jgi:hypothetical protein
MTSIEIRNGEFNIQRTESCGYVQNTVEYDNKSVALINKLYLPSEDNLEGGSCEIHYNFKIIKNTSSEIKFIETHNDGTTIHEKYVIDPSNSIVRYVGNRQNCCIQ